MISIIVAMDKNRAIGKRGSLPWCLPADLARFKQLTSGHPIIMGRRTYDSIGRPLPKRTNIVITKNKVSGTLIKVPDTLFLVLSLEEALDLAKRSPGGDEIFIIGGGEVFKESMSRADKMYVTEIEAGVPAADVFFPEIYDNMWQEIERVHHSRDEKNEFDYNFVTYERK